MPAIQLHKEGVVLIDDCVKCCKVAKGVHWATKENVTNEFKQPETSPVLHHHIDWLEHHLSILIFVHSLISCQPPGKINFLSFLLSSSFFLGLP